MVHCNDQRTYCERDMLDDVFVLCTYQNFHIVRYNAQCEKVVNHVKLLSYS